MAKFNTFTLDAKTKTYCQKKAEQGSTEHTREFFAGLLESCEQYGSITEKMMNAIKKEQQRDKDRANGPKLKDENGVLGPVNNQVMRDHKPVCFIKGCKDLAKLRVGDIGVCGPDHVEEAIESNEQFHARLAAGT